MALFNVSVLSTLNIPREEREMIRRIALALEALVAKLNEPPEVPPGYVLETEVQERIDALVARLREDNLEAAEYVRRVYDEQFPGSPPTPVTTKERP